jgi:acyl CoA:acetate/3-ketoacid CoA transferase beta subunit
VSASGWTIDELLCCVMARQIEDGDVLLEGIGTFLPTAAYELARAIHAPRVTIFSPLTGSYRDAAVPLGLDHYEAAVARAANRTISYAEMALWHLPAYLPRRPERWKEFLRPAQVDPRGNTNNVLIREGDHPAVRLPGAVGVPDSMSLHEQVFLYLPRHERRAFAPRVDVVSGVGGDGLGGEVRRTRAERLMSELGVFDFEEQGLTAVSLHRGVSIERVRASTAIPVHAPVEVPETEAPSDAELEALRETIDPLGLRRLEFLPSRQRLVVLRSLLDGDRLRPVPATILGVA